MEVKLEKRYPLQVESARAWAVLRDVPAVATCMPGAAITEQTDERHYKGKVKVKIGPASADFAGEIEVLALDAAAMKLQLLAKGADRGGSSATMNLTATIEAGETAGTSVLVGDAAVIVNGKFAQFGGRMMVQVSDMLLLQFADNFRRAAAALPAPEMPAASAAVPGAADGAALAPGAVAAAAVAAPAAAPAAAAPAATAAAPPAKANEINALALIWGLIKGWIGGLFGKRN
jgi:carbon monoxide dehydrogenase subunit G